MGGLSQDKSPPRLMLSAQLTVNTKGHVLSVLIDSGAEQNFIDSELAHRLQLEQEPLPHTLHFTALSGQRLPDITHVTEPVILTLSGNHSEEICFFVFKATRTPLILGHPWLRQHNRSINWLKVCITGWGEECHMTCLKSASPPHTAASPAESTAPSDLSGVPLFTMISLKCFARIGPSRCLHIGLTIALSTCTLARHCPQAVSTASLYRCGRLWSHY